MVIKFFKALFNLAILSIFVSCSSPQDDNPLSAFKGQPIKLTPIFIDTDKPILFGGEIKMVTDSILAVQTPKEDTLLTLIHIPEETILKRIIPKGKGPGEMTMTMFCNQTNKDQLFIYDPNQPKVFCLDMKTIMTDKIEPIVKLRNLNMLKIDSFYIVSGPSVMDNRFQIFDIHGDLISSCMHYDKPEEHQSLPDHLYSVAFQGVYAVHPNNEKFVFAASGDGGRIQYFDFISESISLNADLFFYHPSFTFDNRGLCISNENSIWGFSGIEGGKHFVYTLYSGKLIKDHVEDPTCRHLLVFDWNGNPVKRYELDIPLATFCLNKTGDKIYGIAYQPETVIVQYDLK